MTTGCSGTIRLGLILGVLGTSLAAAGEPLDDAYFEAKVRPILVARCLECHGETGKPKGGLRLSSRQAVLDGGDSGPAAVAGKPDESGLVAAIRYLDDPKMPPKGKLPDDEAAVLRRWVEIGLPWPSDAKPVMASTGGPFRISAEQRQFWSFQPLKVIEPPVVRDPRMASHPIDRFVGLRLERAGIEPARPADPSTLLRRITFDLTGLPPSPEDLDRFLLDQSPEAFETVVDRLLATPAYGQRWGRHWLDVVRYADSRDARGVGSGDDITEAYRYRDWVVDALNRDLPYDQFIIQQIAGDQLPGETPSEINPGGMIATGLLTIGEWGTGDADKEKMLTDIVADQIDVVTRGFLGLTVACARCHDHKFDPISAADYYGLAGIFFSTRILPDPGAKTAGSPMLRTPVATQAHRQAIMDHQRRLREANRSLSEAESQAGEAVARSLLPRIREVMTGESTTGIPVPAFAVRQMARLLGTPDEGRRLDRPMISVQGRKGVDFWSGRDDPPWVGVNSTGEPVAIGTLTLPPRSVNLHPGTQAPAAIRWLSPIGGVVQITGKILDADPNGGNGIDWSVSVRSGRTRRELGSGSIDNGGSKTLGGEGLARVEVMIGDSIELAIGPRGDYGFDTTSIAFKIDRSGQETQSWDVTADLVPDLLKANPHADRQGNGQVWELIELDPSKPLRPFAGHLAWAEWDRSDHSATAIEAFARQVESDPALAKTLLLDKGPLRPVRGDDSSLLEAGRAKMVQVRQARDQILAQAPPAIPLALVALEGGVPKSVYEGFHDTAIQVRGDYRRLGPVVPRHVPEVVAGASPPVIRQGSGRLELARWIASKDNPLTARVIVNRIWQGHFGSGLVRTSSNFGKLGEAPSDPDLLDWLANRLIVEGWSLKKFHKLVVMSQTYQQSTVASPEARRVDPENRLFGRIERRRLESESIRDALLAVAGRLDLSLGGPSTRDFNSPRRTLYQMTIRSDRSSFGPLFDAADSTAMVDRRVVSTVAPQALFLMNHPFVVDQAKALGDRLRAASTDDRARITHAYQWLYARSPTPEEVAVGLDLVARITEAEGSVERAWAAYAQVLVCANEFLFVD